MRYGKHRLTASVVYVTTLTYASSSDRGSGFVLLANWSVRQKPNRVSSVQFSSVTSLCIETRCTFIVCGVVQLRLSDPRGDADSVRYEVSGRSGCLSP